MNPCRVQARLPALGVRLGAISTKLVTLGIGDYSGRDRPYRACLVPVQGDAKSGFAFYRAGPPKHPPDVCPEDIGEAIRLTDRFGPTVPGQEQEQASRALPSGEYQNDDRVVLPSAMLSIDTDPGLWGNKDDRSQSGVMVLMIYLLISKDISINGRSPFAFEPGEPDPYAIDIAKAINDVLKTRARDEIDLVVVPSKAVRPALDRLERDRFDEMRFALSSCQYTLGMIDGSPAGLTKGPGDDSYGRLLDRVRIDPPPGPQFAVLAGDQVYVDATAGLFDPTASRGRFRKPYEQLYGSRIVRDLQRRLRCYMVMDDHEVEDNWEDAGNRRLRDRLQRKGGARDAYVEYERGIGTLPQPDPPGRLWCEVEIDGFDFFFADTRTEREQRTAEKLQRALIMSLEQHEAIRTWLSKDEGDVRPRFLVCSAMPFPRRLATAERPSAALLSDAWDGYPASLQLLLDAVASAGRSNIVFLSGDEHLSSVATVALTTRTGETVQLRSIHCSGLYSPYPFANSIVEDFAADGDELPIQGPPYCPARVVETKFFSGQGFCVISVEKTAARWNVHVEFDLLPSGGHDEFSIP